MKTKILVAMIACLAIGACSKTEVHKEETKTETETTTPAGGAKTDPAPGTGTTTPSAPAGGHSSIESTTNVLAADDTAAQQPAAAAQDADKKLQDMKQDMSSTANQIQGSTTSTEAKADTHNHAED